MIFIGAISPNMVETEETPTSSVQGITIHKSKIELPLSLKPHRLTRGEFSQLIVESLGVDASNAESNFRDVPKNHPNYREISALAERHIMNGMADGSFRPEQNITRAEYAKVTTLAFAYSPTNQSTIPDVVSHWANQYITTMVDAGLMNLDENGNFRPDEYVVLEPKGQLIPIVTPPQAMNKKVTWTSSNPAIAEVDEVGQVTPKSLGTAIITASTVDGGFQAASEVKVIEAEAEASGPIVYDVYDDSWEVKGKAEGGATIEVKANGVVIGTSTASPDGTFSVVIQKQKAGVPLEVAAKNENGDLGSTTVIVLSSFTLKAPNVDWVKDSDTRVTGTFEKDSIVTVKIQDKVIGTGVVDEFGQFYIPIDPQPEGTILTVSAKNIDEYESKETLVTVQKTTDVPTVQGIAIHKSNMELPLNTKPHRLTRGEFSRLVVESLGIEASYAGSIFTDVPKTHPYAREISTLVNLNIVSGYPDGSFRPENSLTRAEYAVLFTRALGYTPSNKTTIRDVPESHWANTAITIMVDAGIMELEEDGNFYPNNEVFMEPKGQLIPIVTPLEAIDKRVNWSSSNPKVAEVDEVGQVTPKSIGTAIITATTVDGGFQAKSEVKVTGQLQIHSMELMAKELSVGDMQTVKMKVTSPNTIKTIKMYYLNEQDEAKEIVFTNNDEENTYIGTFIIKENDVSHWTAGKIIIEYENGMEPASINKENAKEYLGEDFDWSSLDFTVKDVTPPDAPIVNDLDNKTTEVTGRAEPGSVITVRADGKVLGTATTDDKGNFSVKIEKQSKDTKIEVTATDKAGNTSDTTSLTVKSPAQQNKKCPIELAFENTNTEQTSLAALRQFRDEHLMKSKLGQAFVELYYKSASSLANVVEGNEFLKKSIRTILTPVVGLIK